MFESLLKLSLYGGIAAVVVLLLRLIPRLRPNVKFLLWCLVFLRLVVPPDLLTIPSPVSLQAVVPEQAVEQALPARVTQPSDPGSFPKEYTSGGSAIPGESAFLAASLMELLWIGGAAVCLILLVFFYTRALLRPRHETTIPGVYTSDYFHSPVVMGILRPRILLPVSMNPDALDNTLLHERTHIRRGDHLLKPLFLAVAAIHWFNPLVWLAYCLAMQDMEMAVDEAVLRALPGDHRKKYASELLFAAQSRSFAFPGFGESNVKRRIKGILNFQKPSRWILAASLVLLAAVGAFLLTGGQQPVKSDSLYAYKSDFVGDNSNTVNLLSRLPYGGALKTTELKTDAQPYAIIATYDFTVYNSIPQNYEQVWKSSAAAVFALIGNVDELCFNSGANTFYTARRAELEKEFGQDLRLYAKDEATFDAFFAALPLEPVTPPATSAKPVSRPTPNDAPAFLRLGENDPLADFTVTLPADCTASVSQYDAIYRRNGFFAGGISMIGYSPEDGYSQLINNHTERTGEWEEPKVVFVRGGAWADGIDKIVVGHFSSDDYDDVHSGRLYDHTTYNLIFKKINTSKNRYTGETLSYRHCYQLDFVTTYYAADGAPTAVFTQEEIQAAVRSFALKGDEIYMPAKSYTEMQIIAEDFIKQALVSGSTPEAKIMYEAMGRPKEINLSWSSWADMENGQRMFHLACEDGGVRAEVRIEMDTGNVLGLTWTTM